MKGDVDLNGDCQIRAVFRAFARKTAMNTGKTLFAQLITIKGSRLQWHYLKRIVILNKEIELG